MRSALAVLLDTRPAGLLLDFDGPLCSIFASYKNNAVSSRLRDALAGLGTPLPDHVLNQVDPLEILRWAASLDEPAVIHAVEDTLREAELRAASTAMPTPGARDVLLAASDTGQRVSVVSNNSATAISAYLDAHGLREYVTNIVGREPYRPDLMKPNPYAVYSSLNALNFRPAECVLVGDSPTDVEASHAVGVRAIGFANALGKLAALTSAGADAIVMSMAGLATGLRVALRQSG